MATLAIYFINIPGLSVRKKLWCSQGFWLDQNMLDMILRTSHFIKNVFMNTPSRQTGEHSRGIPTMVVVSDDSL